jgi:F0F1-type ATP synthase assembly protein I
MDMTGGERPVGPERSLPLLIVVLQLMTSLVVAAGFALIDNSEAAVAALLAGAACVIPGGWFGWRITMERSPARLLGQGVMKFLLTVTLMALAIVAFQPAPLGFFTAFVLMQTMYVTGPMIYQAWRDRHWR